MHDLLHHRLVYLQTACRVNDDYVHAFGAGSGVSVAHDLDGRNLPVLMHWHANLRTERHQLLNGGRAVDVCRHEHRVVAFLFEMQGQFRGVRRLPGSLRPHEHDARRRCTLEHERHAIPTEQVNEGVVDEGDHLLCRVESLLLRRPTHEREGLRSEAVNEGPRHFQVHVGFKEREAYLFHRLINVFFGDAPLPAEFGENPL